MSEPFTVVYRGLTNDERSAITADPKAVWFGWCHAPYERDKARAAAQAAQPEAGGWKLVPIEPTPAMLVAMWDHRESMRGQSENRIARAGYAAMLASAPTPEPMSAPTAEPVAWAIIASNTGRMCQVTLNKYEIEGHNPAHIVPLYATPPSAATPEPSDAERWGWLVNDCDGNEQDDFIQWLAFHVASKDEINARADAAIRGSKGGKL